MNVNRENMTKFVEALRSDKYKQIKGRLRIDLTDRFCAEGVACDVSGVGQWDIYGQYIADRVQSMTTAPSPVLNWLGISPFEGLKLCDEAPRPYVIDANDDGMSFDEIAAWLEKTYLQ